MLRLKKNAPTPAPGAPRTLTPKEAKVGQKQIAPFQEVIDGSHPNGPELVDASYHVSDHPPEIEGAVKLYYDDFVNGRHKIAHFEDSGCSPKFFAKLFRKQANHDGPRGSTMYMVKPYCEDMYDCDYMYYPNAGWAEMTMQGLYRVSGLGRVCQKVFTYFHEFPPQMKQSEAGDWVTDGKPRNIPLVVVVMDKGVRCLGDISDDGKLGEIPDEIAEDMTKVAFIDYLTNNNDRHENNLMIEVDPHGNGVRRILAVDNGRSFNYTVAMRHQYEMAKHDHLYFYLRSSPVAETFALKHRDLADPKYLGPAVRWWQEKRVDIVQELYRHLSAIVDPRARQWIRSNFDRRAAALDAFASAWRYDPDTDRYDPFTPGSDEKKKHGVGEASYFTLVPILKHTPDEKYKSQWNGGDGDSEGGDDSW